MSQLNYLEFNLIYHRYNHMKDISNIEYIRKSNQYIMDYSGPPLVSVDMLIHKVKVINDNQWLVTPYTLSEIYDKYTNLSDLIDLTEELSEDYIRFIFHKLTKRNYLKYLSEQELIDYENFINRKVKEAEEVNRREIKKLSKSVKDILYDIS